MFHVPLRYEMRLETVTVLEIENNPWVEINYLVTSNKCFKHSLHEYIATQTKTNNYMVLIKFTDFSICYSHAYISVELRISFPQLTQIHSDFKLL
jgi:hypothetical protein